MDSKISQLPSAHKIYDHDLLIAVTGYDIAGSYPDNVKISFDRVRNDIIRLNEMIFITSGLSGYYNSGNNTLAINLNIKPGTGIYFKSDLSWPHLYEIGLLEQIYDSADNYSISTGTTSIDEHLLFPLVFPSSIQSLKYTKWKCEGYYNDISLTTYIPAIEPMSTGPLGQPITWGFVSLSNLSQGYIIPQLFNFSYFLNDNNIKTYSLPIYDYSDNKIVTHHHTTGSKSHSVNNAHFLAFFTMQNIVSGYSSPSGGLGFMLSPPWFEPPTATSNWTGVYYVEENPVIVSTGIPVTGYATNISINGHRFIEIKPV